jgi:hypothetical protein
MFCIAAKPQSHQVAPQAHLWCASATVRLARGIVAEPATKARRAEVADAADSPTRGGETAEAARPKNVASRRFN